MDDRQTDSHVAAFRLLMTALLAAAPVDSGRAAARPALISRLDEIRDRIDRQAQTIPNTSPADAAGQTVQFPNFPNFRNFTPGGPGFVPMMPPFSNFPNFNNFNNFPNFPNFVAPMWRNF